MLSAIFVANGAQALVNPDPLAIRAKRVTDRVAPLLEKAPVQLPTDARTLVRVNGAVQALAGLLLASGRAAAAPRRCWPGRSCRPRWPVTRSGSTRIRRSGGPSGSIS
ncbi:hypothetical protein Psuf_032910 [Phytohabitans suffuscus]|uniref:Uncharacterized protein n=1 Tax=Phytohabitans suffuscus TaxID=624315 RepID=A0A6F8YJ33_9ACTN|nr:hypothetical protein Psuf_032910 [Phytohabitans suffuscus]